MTRSINISENMLAKHLESCTFCQQNPDLAYRKLTKIAEAGTSGDRAHRRSRYSRAKERCDDFALFQAESADITDSTRERLQGLKLQKNDHSALQRMEGEESRQSSWLLEQERLRLQCLEEYKATKQQHERLQKGLQFKSTYDYVQIQQVYNKGWVVKGNFYVMNEVKITREELEQYYTLDEKKLRASRLGQATYDFICNIVFDHNVKAKAEASFQWDLVGINVLDSHFDDDDRRSRGEIYNRNVDFLEDVDVQAAMNPSVHAVVTRKVDVVMERVVVDEGRHGRLRPTRAPHQELQDLWATNKRLAREAAKFDIHKLPRRRTPPSQEPTSVGYKTAVMDSYAPGFMHRSEEQLPRHQMHEAPRRRRHSQAPEATQNIYHPHQANYCRSQDSYEEEIPRNHAPTISAYQHTMIMNWAQTVVNVDPNELVPPAVHIQDARGQYWQGQIQTTFTYCQASQNGGYYQNYDRYSPQYTYY